MDLSIRAGHFEIILDFRGSGFVRRVPFKYANRSFKVGSEIRLNVREILSVYEIRAC